VLLVLRGGQVVREEGENGHDAAEVHALAMGTAGFWGVAAAAAQADGLLGLDEAVSATLPQFAAEPWRRQMRVRDLLHFTSGLAGGVRALAPGASPDPYARALALDMVAPPGERFQYGPSHVYVFAELLSRKLEAHGRAADPVAWLRQRLLDPIGAEVAAWDGDALGRPDPATGAHLTARAWARFGLLLAEGGRWQGRALIDAEALAPVFEGSRANPSFGGGLWLNRSQAPAAAAASFGASGHGLYGEGPPDLVAITGLDNQRLYVVPSLRLVVVRFGERDRSFRDEELLRRLVGSAQTAPGA
jgi:CubicO group peptidase (beta-lactamase class C family)